MRGFRKFFKGADDLLVDVAFITVASIVGSAVVAYLLNSQLVQRAAGVPVLGTAINGVQALDQFRG